MAVTFVVVVPASRGGGLSPALLAAGVVLTSLIALLVGFIAAARYDSVSSFLLPSQLYLLPLNLPVLHYFGYWQSPFLYLIPTQGSLILLRGAFTPVEAWQVVYALAYQVIWVAVLARLALRAYNRYIIAGRGVR
jgi:fluoroquinolone transport system permease protein